MTSASAFSLRPVPQLVAIRDVAEILGVSLPHAHKLVNSNSFPEPYSGDEGRLARGRVWRRVDVERWNRQNPVPAGKRRRRGTS